MKRFGNLKSYELIDVQNTIQDIYHLKRNNYISDLKEEDVLAAWAARQRKQEDAGAASAAFDIEELQYYKKLFEDIYKDFQDLGI